MAKKNKREEIIRTAMRLFHAKGYNGVGINDVLEATNIPKGSFYYYFSSKEDLIQQTVMYYMAEIIAWTNSCSCDISGLRAFFRKQFDVMKSTDYREGCPVGGITNELAGSNDEIRSELRIMERHVTEYVKRALINSFHFNDPRAGEYAQFVLFTFQGAVIKSRLERDDTALKLFDKFIFDMLLRHDSKEVQKESKVWVR